MSNTILIKDLQEVLCNVSTCLSDSVSSLALSLKKELYHQFKTGHDYLSTIEKSCQDLRPTIQEKLKEYQYCTGAGFASHVYNSKEHSDYWLLEWWFKKPSKPNNQQLTLDQATQQRLDFRTFDWFIESKTADTTYIHGPYVDYVCNTSYTLTAAHPIFINNTFVGVAVIDLLVSKLEELLNDSLRKIEHDLLITNADGRVIVSNHSTQRVGNLIKDISATNYDIVDHGFFQILYKPKL